MTRRAASFLAAIAVLLGFGAGTSVRKPPADPTPQEYRTEILHLASEYIGLREGDPRQVEMNRVAASCSLDGKCWLPDNAHWCGSFAGWVVSKAGQPVPVDYFRAREWIGWGRPLDPGVEPQPGMVYVVDRHGGGHVGIVHHVDSEGVWLVSGNISNEVVLHLETRTRLYVGSPE